MKVKCLTCLQIIESNDRTVARCDCPDSKKVSVTRTMVAVGPKANWEELPATGDE